MVANLSIKHKTLSVNWKKPFELVVNRPKFNIGGEALVTHLTLCSCSLALTSHDAAASPAAIQSYASSL